MRASEMLYPVLPPFVTGVLGAPVAAVGLYQGVIGAGSVHISGTITALLGVALFVFGKRMERV
jgi:hypothetical protein